MFNIARQTDFQTALNNKGRLKRKNKGRVHHVLFIFSSIKGRLKNKFQTAFA